MSRVHLHFDALEDNDPSTANLQIRHWSLENRWSLETHWYKQLASSQKNYPNEMMKSISIGRRVDKKFMNRYVSYNCAWSLTFIRTPNSRPSNVLNASQDRMTSKKQRFSQVITS